MFRLRAFAVIVPPHSGPLHVACGHLAHVTQAITVFDRSCEYKGYRLDATVRVPGESCDIVGRVVVAEIVQQKKRIEILGLAETEGALESDSRAFDGRLGLNDLLNWAQ
jgi:hypothetical protein